MNLLSRDRWAALWQAAGASGDPRPWFESIKSAYAEPHRHYHNQRHIAECLIEFDGARHLAGPVEMVEFALWFHDAVYDPKAGDNEERSAALAERCLAEAGMRGAFVEHVNHLVTATKCHEVDADADVALMVDIDLSIFGQATERFTEYEAQIREEYAWVPEALFDPKRAEILKRFLDRERIYATDWFHHKFEQQARLNLEASLDRLGRFIP